MGLGYLRLTVAKLRRNRLIRIVGSERATKARLTNLTPRTAKVQYQMSTQSLIEWRPSMTCNSWLYFALHGGFGVDRSNSIFFSLNDGLGQYQLICVFPFTWVAPVNTWGTASVAISNPFILHDPWARREGTLFHVICCPESTICMARAGLRSKFRLYGISSALMLWPLR